MTEQAEARGRTDLRPAHAVDALFVLGLTALSLWGWSTTFHGPGMWISALVVAAIGMAVSLVVTGLRGNLALAFLALVFVFYLASGPVVSGVAAMNGISALGARVGGTGEAWVLLLGTIPPIDAAGTVLLAPTLTSLAGAGLAMAVAVRSRRPALPLVTLVLMLVAVLLTGRPEPVEVLGQGLGFGAVALIWVRMRTLRLDEDTHGRDPLRSRRLVSAGALLVVAAVITGLLTSPGAARDRLLLRDQVAPYDVESVRTPLDDFRDFTRLPLAPKTNLWKRELFTVAGAEGQRLRFATLTDYDGRHWLAANDTVPGSSLDRYLRVSSTIDNPADEGDEVGVSVVPSQNWERPWVPLLGSLQGFDFSEQARQEAPGNLRVDLSSESALLTDDLTKLDSYSFVTRTSAANLGERMRPSRAVDEDLFEAAEFLQPAVTAWSFGARTPIGAIFKIAATLKRVGRYSDGAIPAEGRYQPGQSVKRLGADFVLADPSVGNGEQYAAAMALMITRLRIPARVVIGAVVPEDGVVRGAAVQPWVEVRIANGTWRVLQLDKFMGRRPPDREKIKPGALPPRDFPEPDTTQQQPDLDDPLADQPDTPMIATAPVTGGVAVPWPVLVLLVLVLIAGVVPGAKWLRRRRRLGRATVTGRFAGAWEELVDTAVDLGVTVPGRRTRPAQARALVPVGAGGPETEPPDEGPRDDEPLAALADEADRRIFGAEEPGRDEAADYWDRVRRARRGLAAGQSRRRRLWAIFNPASLSRRS